MKKIFLISAVIATTLSACVSVPDSTSQDITFTISPVETVCTVSNNHNQTIGSISGKLNVLTVSKGYGDLVVHCSADGYENKAIYLTSSARPESLISATTSLELGVMDVLTGTMWKYPEKVTIILEKRRTENSSTNTK